MLALLVVLVGAPGGPAVVLVGAFMLAAPGLLLAEVIRVDDALLALVMAMMAGPVLWVVLPTAEVFVGAWHPEMTVGIVAAGLAAVAAALLVGRTRTVAPKVTQSGPYRSSPARTSRP